MQFFIMIIDWKQKFSKLIRGFCLFVFQVFCFFFWFLQNNNFILGKKLLLTMKILMKENDESFNTHTNSIRYFFCFS